MKRLFVIWVIIFLLLPVFAFAQEECIDCSEPGGLVPCGRKCNDPTTEKNECLPCTLCDFFVMIDSAVDLALKISVPVLVILIISVIAITAYARARSAPESINKVKRALMGVVIGLIIVYGAWVIVNSILVALGVATWSNVNELWIINCPEPEIREIELVRTFCPDGKIQRPNNDEFPEVCDGDDLGGQSCRGLGYESGDLACLEDCSDFDTTECVAYPPLAKLSLPFPAPMNPEPLPYESVGTFVCDCKITVAGIDHSGEHEYCLMKIEYDRGKEYSFVTFVRREVSWQLCWIDTDTILSTRVFDPHYKYLGREPGYTSNFTDSKRCTLQIVE